MSCPRCRIADISSSGKCPVCGYQSPAPIPTAGSEPDAKDSSNFAGMIEIDYSEGAQDSEPKEEVPQWRKDLSKRLQEIKLKKEATAATGPKAQTESKILQAPESQTRADSSAAALPAKARLVEIKPIRKPTPNPPTPIPRQKTLQPLERETTAAKPDAKTGNTQDIKKLIDAVVSRQSAPAGNPARPAEDTGIAPEHFADGEGKLMLLSRTLSGLIDLICIVICTGIFIIAADYFSGIIMPDSISVVVFSVLLLMNYFVYSLFFITASNQTIGMMITDLRVVGIDKRRPSMTQLATRCCCHLLSLLGLGIGLIWSLFNRESLCLHDRLSKTRVVRI
jgi:uncharacterized RDD family membrane protein YckC